jgi:hypothetical protein
VLCGAVVGLSACGGSSKNHGQAASDSTAGAPSAGSGGAGAVGGDAFVSGGASVSGGSSVGGTAPAGAGAASTGGNGGTTTLGGSSAGGESTGAGGVLTNGAMPSPACALAKDPPAANLGFARYKLPANYDGVTPLPVIIELQATNVRIQLATPYDKRAKPLGDRYIIVAPEPNNSIGSFESMQQMDFMALVAKSLDEVCFDWSRVFAAGNGSGGRVLMTWLVNSAVKAAAQGIVVPPVRAAAVVGAYSGGYSVATPVIFIHSTSLPDSRAFDDLDGLKALQRFVTGNKCSDSTAPVAVAGCSTGDIAMDPHCVDFEGCTAALRWCQPDDAASMASADPWPCFSNAAIDQFFTPYLD